MYHYRTKHIGVKYHFIHFIILNGVLQVEKISTNHSPSDMGTKVVPTKKLEFSCILITCELEELETNE